MLLMPTITDLFITDTIRIINIGNQFQRLTSTHSQHETARRSSAHAGSGDPFLSCSRRAALPCSMLDASEPLTPADPADLAAALAFALRYQGRKRVHNTDEIMAEIAAARLVDHLERAGFVVMKRPAGVGAAALGRGFEG